VSSEPVGEAEGFSEIRDAREAAAMEAAECGVN